MSLATQEVKTKANEKTIIFAQSEVGFFLFIAKVKKRNEKKKKKKKRICHFNLHAKTQGKAPDNWDKRNWADAQNVRSTNTCWFRNRRTPRTTWTPGNEKLGEAAKREKHEKYERMKQGPAENMTVAVWRNY